MSLLSSIVTMIRAFKASSIRASNALLKRYYSAPAPAALPTPQTNPEILYTGVRISEKSVISSVDYLFTKIEFFFLDFH